MSATVTHAQEFARSANRLVKPASCMIIWGAPPPEPTKTDSSGSSWQQEMQSSQTAVREWPAAFCSVCWAMAKSLLISVSSWLATVGTLKISPMVLIVLYSVS